MGQAISPRIRLAVNEAFEQESLSYIELSSRFDLSYNTVRSICRNYVSDGHISLFADYSRCGRQVSDEAERSYRFVRLLKHLHPRWGIRFILTQIRMKYPDLFLQSDRHYQRRIRADRSPLTMPSVKHPPKLHGDIPRTVHDEWQIDAKERITLPNGSQCCYLNITDTVSHALLKAKSFPPRADFSGANGGYFSHYAGAL